MLKRLIEWIKSLFKKTTTSWTAKPDSGTPAPNVGIQPPIYTDPSVVNPFVKWMLLGYTMPDILRIRQQRGESASLNALELEQARQAGYLVDVVAVAPVDRSGFDLREGDGWYVMNELQDGTYTFTYTIRPDTTKAEVTVFMGSGSRLREVNGQIASVASSPIPVPAVPGKHSITISVKSVGAKNVGVQLQQYSKAQTG